MTPRTAASRLFLKSLPPEWHPINLDIVADHLSAIEAEAAQGSKEPEPLDVERLRVALKAVAREKDHQEGRRKGYSDNYFDGDAEAIAAAYAKVKEGTG